jgi:aryl-alcohol dehydrogenase-like predicted oxidoreductase
MDYRRLGRTGLQVSCFCLGTMQWGWTVDEPTACAVMDAFVERGGNFLDTADFYSRWLPGHYGESRRRSSDAGCSSEATATK